MLHLYLKCTKCDFTHLYEPPSSFHKLEGKCPECGEAFGYPIFTGVQLPPTKTGTMELGEIVKEDDVRIAAFLKLIRESTNEKLERYNVEHRSKEPMTWDDLANMTLFVKWRSYWASGYYAAETCNVCRPPEYILGSWEIHFGWATVDETATIGAYIREICPKCITKMIDEGLVKSERSFDEL